MLSGFRLAVLLHSGHMTWPLPLKARRLGAALGPTNQLDTALLSVRRFQICRYIAANRALCLWDLVPSGV